MEGAVWSEENLYTQIAGAKRFELWEANYVNLCGLTEAVKYACNIGIHNIVLHNQILIRHLKNGLEKIPDIIITENGTNSGSILTFTSQVKSLDDMKQIMDAVKVSYSVGFRHFALIDFDKKNVDWVIRLSPHYFNTIEEVDQVVDILES